jgi:UDP-N-acetylglucosamine acyltransferase
VIHPTAIVEAGAQLADDVTLGPYAVIGPAVELGEGAEVGAHAVIMGRTRVGARTRIFPHACIGGEAQVVGPPREDARLEIGADNVLREHVTIHCGSPAGRGVTRLGDRNYLMTGAHVAHDCTLGSDCVVASFTGLAGHVEVGDHAVLGAYTGVHQHCRVGESAMTAAGSKSTKDVAPFVTVAGDRARLVGLNVVGLRRRDFTPDQISGLKRAYRMIFGSGLRVEEAATALESEGLDSPHVRMLIDFVRESERGVVR